MAVKGLLLQLLCLNFFSSIATAQSPADEPNAEAPAADNDTGPRIHGRTPPAAPEDIGEPPARVAKPPLDISPLSQEQCASLETDITNFTAYENQKSIWNLRRITSTGGSYNIGICKDAEDAFDKAADASGAARETTANAAFSKASACRRAFDALYMKECGTSTDLECEAAKGDKSRLDYLDDQNAKFKKDLRRGKKSKRALRCADKARIQRRRQKAEITAISATTPVELK